MSAMKIYFERALANIVKFGDTDIFPLPFENLVFYDKKDDILSILEDIHGHFDKRLAEFPPANEGALAPVSYTGFRWATQIDPIWNAYFLGVVLSIGDEIEAARLPKQSDVVFSYRHEWNEGNSQIFDENYNWRSFMECSLKQAESHKYVVTCDISEFYPRLSHHRLENALRHVRTKSDAPYRIMEFLKNFSGTNSFGLPVGGPAARLLSELTLNQIDRLMTMGKIKFCRFADDYHIFCESHEDAYAALIFLSDKLLRNQGLQLQKSKTRIMSSAEFISTSPLKMEDATAGGPQDDLQAKAQGLLKFSLKFDPYSATAEEDYKRLKDELNRFDIISLLKAELTKSRIHVTLARKIVAAIKYLDEKQKNDAIVSLVDNPSLLYPIFSSVMVVAKAVYDELDESAKTRLIEKISILISSNSHVFRVGLNLSYAIRLLSCRHTPEVEELLANIYNESNSPLIRRDIILVMAKWGVWYWLSDIRTTFRTLTAPERRAFIVSSYYLSDEGKHWRDHTSSEFTPFEKVVKTWVSDKIRNKGWSIPL